MPVPCVDFLWTLCAVLAPVDSGAADRGALERLVQGDHDALGELYDRHGRMVYSLALRVVGDEGDAEDVSQEVFSQVWRQAAKYDLGRGSVLGWLLTLTRSRAIDRLRNRRSRPQLSGDESLISDVRDAAPPADQQLVWAGQAAQIRVAIGALSVLQRVAIELAFFEGLTHAEISERLELPLGTVKTRIRQGLLVLRDRLAGARS